jgi:hypothetical protein
MRPYGMPPNRNTQHRKPVTQEATNEAAGTSNEI